MKKGSSFAMIRLLKKITLNNDILLFDCFLLFTSNISYMITKVKLCNKISRSSIL